MANKARPRNIIIFEDGNGREPFTKWLRGLKDRKARSRILQRLRLVEQGHFGDMKSLGGGLHEFRFFFGSGYRVYFGDHRQNIVVLLLGGDKSSQTRDINKARDYWLEYLRNE